MQAIAQLQTNKLAKRLRKEDSSRKAFAPILTPRQKQIAYLVSLGLTRKAIADEVFLSEGSIALHLSDLFFLLEVKNCCASFAGGVLPPQTWHHQLAAFVNENPELLYVSEKPPLCKIAWFKQQRLKAALVLADVIERTQEESLKRDLNEVLGMLQPEERKNENFRREVKTTLRTLFSLAQNKNPQPKTGD